MSGTTFVVRRKSYDAKSETIARAENYNRAYDEAMAFLMENGRDYECFDVIEVDAKGEIVRDWDCVSWEPRG